jgi:aspartate kinase
MEEIVCKFGGSSLASAEQIRKVWHIIESDPNRRYVVVSAPGKANPGETKVTDLLINLASAVTNHFEGQHYIDLVAQKFGQIARDLGLEKDYEVLVRQDLNDRIEKYKNNSQALMNALKAAGEDNNAKLVADFFKKQGLPAIYVSPMEAGFYLENHKGVVRCLPESYDNLREYLLERHELVVFPVSSAMTKKAIF